MKTEMKTKKTISRMNVMTMLLLAACMMAAPVAANAQTADGVTPAEEEICDALRADGVTKGLYGLCVAFCEAQDFADIDTPITEEELDALEEDSPSGRILANYNKKKASTDPEMPCVTVAECPAWTPEELASIDGVNNRNGNTTTLQCRDNRTMTFGRLILWEDRRIYHEATVDVRPSGARAIYRNRIDIPRITRNYRVGSTMTETEWVQCENQLDAHIYTTLGLTCN